MLQHDDTTETETPPGAADASQHETQPLLVPTVSSGNSDSSGAHASRNKALDSPPLRLQPETVTWLIIAVVFLQTCGECLMDGPRIRITEAIFCYRYYEAHDPSKIHRGRDAVSPGATDGVDEAWCKVDAVQTQLADLDAYQRMLDGLAGLFLALPFGWAADRWGRRPLLLAGMASCVARWAWVLYVCRAWQRCSLAWTLLCSANGLFAGSPSVLYGTLCAVVADVTPPAEQVAVLFRIGAASLFPLLIVPPLSAWLMAVDPWMTSLCGLVLLAGSLSLLTLMPETLPSSRQDSRAIERSRSRRKPGAAPSWALLVTISPFLEHQLIAGTAQLQLQYLSVRFNLAIRQAALFISLRAICSIVLVMLLLPRLSHAMTETRGLNSRVKDLYLARGSLVLQAIGWTATGLSTSLPLVALSMAASVMGSCAGLFLRTLVSTFVPADRTGTVFGVISTVDTLGSMLGAPVLAVSFEWGMRQGEAICLGVPFYIIGLLSAIFACQLFTISHTSLPRPESDSCSDQQDGSPIDTAGDRRS
ncbi:hypothetical protein F66182_526 [Fusarium sp. NRRL 66182]|nr:hypothetical protein F66182_526 [Fusarium sp. NRRL 66182]